MRTSTAVVGASVLIGGLAISGCSAVGKADKAVKAGHSIEQSVKGNQATIDSFTTSMKSSEATPFEATYRTSGTSPETVVYAVRPPKDISFSATPAGSGSSTGHVDIIANAQGEYVCSGSGPSPQCEKTSKVNAAAENGLLDFYTPSHWITFLKGFSLAAGFAGDKVTTSTKNLNGFSMPCVGFRAAGEAGRSTICTAKQGILGYVKVAGDSTSFQLVKYSSSPPSSLFALPAGAKVTTITIPTSVPTGLPTGLPTS
jgi:hypothetical protein